MPNRLEVVEVAPRDGLQNEKVLVSTENKIDLVHRAIAAGARRIEAVSFVNPKAVPQMADAEAVMTGLRNEADLRAQGVSLIGLVLNQRGLERAIAADVDEVNFVVVASETFNGRNQGAEISETLRQISETPGIAREAGLGLGVTIAAAFGCPFEGEVPLERVVTIAEQLAGFGVKEIALADTIGVADPLSIEQRFTAVAAVAPGVRLRGHFHNTRNTGLANAYAAWVAGVKCLDSSIGGIGGCPFAPAATGNIPTEDLVYMFERMGVQTGHDLDALISTTGWLAQVLGTQNLPAMVSRAGGFPPKL